MSDGLGDHVHNALAAVGLTEQRISWWLGKPCNCQQRIEKLNRLGEWAAGAVSATADQAKQALTSLLSA